MRRVTLGCGRVDVADDTAFVSHELPPPRGTQEGDDEGDDEFRAIVPSAHSLDKFDDSTSYVGDILVHTDVRRVGECHELCIREPRCVAWTLDKNRRLCVVRIASSTVLYDASFIGHVLTPAELRKRRSGHVKDDSAHDDLDEPYEGPPWALPAALTAPGVRDNVDLFGGDLKQVTPRSAPRSVPRCGSRSL